MYIILDLICFIFIFVQLYFSHCYLKRVAGRSTRSTAPSDCSGPGTGTCAKPPSKPCSAAANYPPRPNFSPELRRREVTSSTCSDRRRKNWTNRRDITSIMTWQEHIWAILIWAWRQICRRRFFPAGERSGGHLPRSPKRRRLGVELCVIIRV